MAEQLNTPLEENSSNNCSPAKTTAKTTSSTVAEDINAVNEDQDQETITTTTTTNTTIVKATISAGFYPSEVSSTSNNNNNNNIIPKQLSPSLAVLHLNNPNAREEIPPRNRRETTTNNNNRNDQSYFSFLLIGGHWPLRRLANFYRTTAAQLVTLGRGLKRQLARFVDSPAFHEVLCLMVLGLLVLQVVALGAMNVAYCLGWPLCVKDHHHQEGGSPPLRKKNACEAAIFRHFLKNCSPDRVGYLDGRVVPFHTETLEVGALFFLF